MGLFRRAPVPQPGQAGLVSPDEIAVQGGGAPRSGALPSARFLRPRLPRQAYQDAQGLGGQSQGTGGTSIIPGAPGQAGPIAVLDLPVPPTKMPRHAKHSTQSGSPLDTGAGLAGPEAYAVQPWDARPSTWINLAVATPAFSHYACSGGMISDHGVLAEWSRGGTT